ncbi:MAG: protease SohB [Bdellovibrionales bacterium]
MQAWIELGVFTGKVAVVVIGIALVLFMILVLILRAKGAKLTLTIDSLNEKYDEMAQAMAAHLLTGKALKAERKKWKNKEKEKEKATEDRPRVFVLDFVGDIRASHVDTIREEISTILTMARPNQDEVVVRLESPGGMAHAYGLGATQLMRVRDAGVSLTVCVDKVAASGGYMMACTANKILAAPFAIIGSIGVVAQVPNVHRLLKKHDIDYEEITAGEFKRTISVFGEITPKGRQKFLEQIEETHQLFKNFVKDCRPQLDLDGVATGEYWYGRRAQELNLVDELISSDSYLFKKRETADIFKIEAQGHKKWTEKLAESMALAISSSVERVIQRGSSIF